jgi:hypothetical protein
VDQQPFRAPSRNPSSGHQTDEAFFRVTTGRVTVESHVSISTRGLLAIGGMVSGIVLSAAVIVLASTRKLAPGTLPRDRRRS